MLAEPQADSTINLDKIQDLDPGTLGAQNLDEVHVDLNLQLPSLTYHPSGDHSPRCSAGRTASPTGTTICY